MTLRIDYSHLTALLAVERAGSFAGAGQMMGLSAIGVSRRIAKFEASMGAKLLTRKPTRPTEAGKAFCRYAESIEALEDELMAARVTSGLQNDGSAGTFKIAVSEYALSDWIHRLLSEGCGDVGASPGYSRTFDITLAETNDTLDLMRTGEVVAALTTSKAPLHGFKSHTLGAMRYVAIASPAFFEKHFGTGLTTKTLNAAHALRTSNRDRILLDWVEKITDMPATLSPQCLPCPAAIVDACARGTAWALIPSVSISEHIAAGTLINIAPDQSVDRDLYWHVASALAPYLADLTVAVRKVTKSSES